MHWFSDPAQQSTVMCNWVEADSAVDKQGGRANARWASTCKVMLAMKDNFELVCKALDHFLLAVKPPFPREQTGGPARKGPHSTARTSASSCRPDSQADAELEALPREPAAAGQQAPSCASDVQAAAVLTAPPTEPAVTGLRSSSRPSVWHEEAAGLAVVPHQEPGAKIERPELLPHSLQSVDKNRSNSDSELVITDST